MFNSCCHATSTLSQHIYKDALHDMHVQHQYKHPQLQNLPGAKSPISLVPIDTESLRLCALALLLRLLFPTLLDLRPFLVLLERRERRCLMCVPALSRTGTASALVTCNNTTTHSATQANYIPPHDKCNNITSGHLPPFIHSHLACNVDCSTHTHLYIATSRFLNYAYML